MAIRARVDVPVLAVGLLVIGSFFLPFVDLGGVATISGWQVMTEPSVDWSSKLPLVALPAGGAALVGLGWAGHPRRHLAALVFGLGVFGYLAFQLVRFFFATTGWGLWLTLLAAAASILLALRSAGAGRAGTERAG